MIKPWADRVLDNEVKGATVAMLKEIDELRATLEAEQKLSSQINSLWAEAQNQVTELRATQVFGTMPQAEPNGLFTPSSSNAYWVMCLGGDKPVPVFVGTDVIVSPIKLKE